MWNLRGHSAPLDKITPNLVRQAANGAYDLIIIDPIYKVLTGDENSASDMARFCNEFDVISEQLGCTVVYCHHHAKGEAGRRASMDRASGSGVFTRDPDAFLDMSPISVPQDSMDVLWYDSEDGFQMQAHPFRVSYTLREFATPAPTDVLFKWPVHEVTHDLADFNVVGEGRTQSDRGRSGGVASAKSRSSKANSRWGRLNELLEKADTYAPSSKAEPLNLERCHAWLCDHYQDEMDELGMTLDDMESGTKKSNRYCDWYFDGGIVRGRLTKKTA